MNSSLNRPLSDEAQSPTGRIALLSKKRSAFSLVEVVIACAVLIISFGGMIGAMVMLNRQALLSRLQTNARMAVQRNIDRTLSEKFDATTTPAILALTTTSGAVWDDDGGGDNLVTLVTRDGTTTPLASGTMTRRVLAITNSNGADVRSIEFSIAYSYRGRAYTYRLQTTRARD